MLSIHTDLMKTSVTLLNVSSASLTHENVTQVKLCDRPKHAVALNPNRYSAWNPTIPQMPNPHLGTPSPNPPYPFLATWPRPTDPEILRNPRYPGNQPSAYIPRIRRITAPDPLLFPSHKLAAWEENLPAGEDKQECLQILKYS